MRAALSADDDPVDLAQVERPEVGEKGFYREESKACRRVLKRPNARQTVTSILDADAERDVFKISHPPQLTQQQFAQSLVALGEDLKQVPVSSSHDLPNAPDVVGWNVFVKQVAHRVDEDLLAQGDSGSVERIVDELPLNDVPQRVEDGEDVVIERHGRPVAQLVPVRKRRTSPLAPGVPWPCRWGLRPRLVQSVSTLATDCCAPVVVARSDRRGRP